MSGAHDCKTDPRCYVAKCNRSEGKPDMVNHPPHYARMSPEPIDVIEAWGLDFHLAQVLKYIARAGHKDPLKLLEDLQKGRFYLDRRIAQLEQTKAPSLQKIDEVRTVGRSLTEAPSVAYAGANFCNPAHPSFPEWRTWERYRGDRCTGSCCADRCTRECVTASRERYETEYGKEA